MGVKHLQAWNMAVRGLVLGMALCWSVVVGGVAAADDYPMTTGSLTSSVDGQPSSSFRPGATVRLVGSGFAPGATVTVTLYSKPVPLGTFVASASGRIDVDVELPAGTEPGEHTIKARGAAPGGGTTLLSRPVSIEGTSPAPGSAFTGADVAVIGGIGAGAVVAGSGAILAVRRSRARF